MLRPILAFLTLCLAAFLLAPTVASVHQKVEALDIQRELPWHIWKWSKEPTPRFPFDCGDRDRTLYSEITEWPARIQKDEPFTLRGFVGSEEDDRLGVGDIEVDIFLNESKPDPGVFLGVATTDPNGVFWLSSSIPFQLKAAHYHIVAHAKQERIGCITYHEHWSDPEVDVFSDTVLAFDGQPSLVVGRETNITGTLLDTVKGPVVNATVELTIDGETTKVVTDGAGRFGRDHTPARAGELDVSAKYGGSRHYNASRVESSFDVAQEAFALLGGESFVIGRSETFALEGHLYVAEDAREGSFTLTFRGVRASECLECPLNESFTVPLGEDGTFRFPFVVPPSESPGAYTLVASGGGLRDEHVVNLTVEVPTQLALEASDSGLFERAFQARLTLLDEAGRPIVGAPVALFGPDGWHAGATNESGTYALSGSAPCGAHAIDARYNGTDFVRPSAASAEAPVCGYLAIVPPFLLATPWWVWPLLALGLVAAWQLWRGWRQAFAPTIVGGPTLTLTFTEPSDDVGGYVGVGEAVVATAFLEAPLPDGHHLRMGTHRATDEVPLDAELRAHLRLVPDKLGDVHVRADVVDAKGRVVSRRSITLHVVRYGEEIERRYLALRHASGASEAVTPREFERWLHERAPGLDADTVRRLVHVFEEADYSPRVAGRADFAAYLHAERGVQEVSPDATMA